MADDFERMWTDILPIGRSTRHGGYFRQPWTTPERELADWFRGQAAARGMAVHDDGAGNTIAWWEVGSGPRLLTGSHLDSVLDGGPFDGPLGVVSGFAAIDVLRERGFTPVRPIGVGVFVEEEGSRFGMACLGSRLATGLLSWADVRELRDADGVALADVISQAEPGLLREVDTFVELHIEQGRTLDGLDAAVGVGSGIWPHGRYRFDFMGEANHAGTTRMSDRADPMITYAKTVLAARKHAAAGGQVATFGRLLVTPNSTNTVPATVQAWLDARASDAKALDLLVQRVEAAALGSADFDGTKVSTQVESLSAHVEFDPDAVCLVAGPGDERPAWPVISTAAGHDAGVLATSGIRTVMLFVRNPTGVSHAPAEIASVADCLSGVDALADALHRLAS